MTREDRLKAFDAIILGLASVIRDHKAQRVDFALCLLASLKGWSLAEVLCLQRGDFVPFDDATMGCEVRRPNLHEVSESECIRRVRLDITGIDTWTPFADATVAADLCRVLGIEPGEGEILSDEVLAVNIFEDVDLVAMWLAVRNRADKFMLGGADHLCEYHSMEPDFSKSYFVR